MGPLALEVLGALGELEGREVDVGALLEAIFHRSGYQPRHGSVYQALSALQARGHVSSRWGERVAVAGGKRRRLYEVTDAGRRAALLGAVAVPDTIARPRRIVGLAATVDRLFALSDDGGLWGFSGDAWEEVVALPPRIGA